MTRIRIWTEAYRPFTMGGDVRRPVATEVVASGLLNLGGGYKGYVVKAPNGETRVVEATSGAIVGLTLAEVMDDIREASPEVMRTQIANARERAKKADTVDEAEFWRLMRCDE